MGMFGGRASRCAAAIVIVALLAALGAGSAAAAEPHPVIGSFGSFLDPNGIAVDEATGSVYVADVDSDAVYKFDSSGKPSPFSSLGANQLTGAATPQKSFSFVPQHGNGAMLAVDNACAEQTPSLSGEACAKFDPSAGDLYVVDPTNDVVDKFNAAGEFLGEISSPHGNVPIHGVGVDANGDLRLYVEWVPFVNPNARQKLEVFDNSVENAFLTDLVKGNVPYAHERIFLQEDGFGVAPNGDTYMLGSCGCFYKLGSNGEELGLVDLGGSDVAAAVDPVTGHLYVDEQTGVSEWDTGSMNGNDRYGEFVSGVYEWGVHDSAAFVSKFGRAQLATDSTGEGGIAVDGATGEVYVTSPVDGKVYVFGSDAPAVSAGAPKSVTQGDATLTGTVDPRGESVTACRFEYEAVDFYLWGENEGSARVGSTIPYLFAPAYGYHHTVPCAQSEAEIGTGAAPVSVDAEATALEAGRLYDFRLVVETAAGDNFADGRFTSKGPGFGFQSVEMGFFNEDGTPDTQAGSHPYQMVTDIQFNKQVEANEAGNPESLYIAEPDGHVRDILTDLPVGLVGNPNATAKKCTLAELEGANGGKEAACPAESQVGVLEVQFPPEYNSIGNPKQPVYNMVPPHGVAAQLGTNMIIPNATIDNEVVTGGDYAVRASARQIPAIGPIMGLKLTINGVVGSGAQRKAFLTMPTACVQPLKATFSADSHEAPGHYVEETALPRDQSNQRLSLAGCSRLHFAPAIRVAPDTKDASTASGLTVDVHVPQQGVLNPEGLAESALRDTSVTLPEGVAINPSGADGLEACSETLAGFGGFKELDAEFEPGVQTATFAPGLPDPLQPGSNFCPNGAKIGTVEIDTPLLAKPLTGAVYLATQTDNPFGSLVAMYMVVQDPSSGTLIKLAGEVALSDTGQIVTTFKNTPDLPFEDLTMHFFGGERAPLAMPSRCGTYTTEAVFTPWDGNPPVRTDSSFTIDHGPNGGPCPGASLPFNPTLDAGLINNQAGTSSPFTMTMSREDGEQNLQAISMNMPPGVMGSLTGVKLCEEAQANAGTCGSESLIGETTVSVGLGNDPFTVKGGRVYLTGPYDGAPFGLSIVNPAKAGPYDLEQGTACDCIVVRAKIEVNPLTAQLTVSSDNGGPHAIPTILKGIPLQIKHVNVTVNRPDFMLNPTSCAKMNVTGTLYSAEGASQGVSVPLQVANCAKLPFKPQMLAFTEAHHTRKTGAYLHVVMKSGSGQVGLREVHVELPKSLPSVLKTLQQACTEAQFAKSPAGCPAGSVVGRAVIHTPVLPVALKGKAYFVSHGGAKFPELVIVLHGYGVTIQLNGETFISKAGVTSSTFKTLPDVPFSRFDLILPRGTHPALTGNGDLCAKQLKMPTRIVAQSGRLIERNTTIHVKGCKPYLKVVGKHAGKAGASLVVKVAPAGKLFVGGKGIQSIARTVRRAGKVRLRLHLDNHDKQVLASHRHRRLKLSLDVRFAASNGSELHERVTVLMR